MLQAVVPTAVHAPVFLEGTSGPTVTASRLIFSSSAQEERFNEEF
jgi:hypothetical protein